MSTPQTAMIFAAGRGTRMQHLTTSRPKALVEVAGQSLLDIALGQVQAAGVKDVIVNAHYFGDQIVRHIGDLNQTEIRISNEPDQLLETGGGMRHAAPLLGDNPVFTLNADTVWRGVNPLDCLRNAWEPDKMEALLLVIAKDRATGHKSAGDFSLDPAGRPIRRGNRDSAPYVYVGCQIIAPALVYAHPETVFSFNTIWDQMIARGTLFATVFPGQWCDVGQPDSIPLAEAMLA